MSKLSYLHVINLHCDAIAC